MNSLRLRIASMVGRSKGWPLRVVVAIMTGGLGSLLILYLLTWLVAAKPRCVIP